MTMTYELEPDRAGCITYLTDSARNISGSEVGVTVGSRVVPPVWSMGKASGQRVRRRSPPEADDVSLIQ